MRRRICRKGTPSTALPRPIATYAASTAGSFPAGRQWACAASMLRSLAVSASPSARWGADPNGSSPPPYHASYGSRWSGKWHPMSWCTKTHRDSKKSTSPPRWRCPVRAWSSARLTSGIQFAVPVGIPSALPRASRSALPTTSRAWANSSASLWPTAVSTSQRAPLPPTHFLRLGQGTRQEQHSVGSSAQPWQFWALLWLRRDVKTVRVLGIARVRRRGRQPKPGVHEEHRQPRPDAAHKGQSAYFAATRERDGGAFGPSM